MTLPAVNIVLDTLCLDMLLGGTPFGAVALLQTHSALLLGMWSFPSLSCELIHT